MALFIKNAVIKIPITPLIEFKRFRGKINIQKPKPPNFPKALCLAVAKPWFKKIEKTPLEQCTKDAIPRHLQNKERNYYQEIVAGELRQYFFSSKFVLFCHANPISSETRYEAYLQFYRAEMGLKQFGKGTMELALKNTPYEPVLDFFLGHNMLIFSAKPQIATALKILRKFPQLVPLAGIVENRLLNKDELVFYSKIPNIQAAQAGLVQTLNTLGSNLVQNLNSHQNNLVTQLEQRAKQLQEE